MPTIYLVRHGRAAAGYDVHPDPGLDAVGRAQAEATAQALADEIGAPVPIYSSPLARARETAAPLAERWQARPVIEPRVAEIPTPSGWGDDAPDQLRERGRWLRGLMAGGWADVPPELAAWRRAMIACVQAFETDAVVFCHFIAINVIVGAALGAEEVVVFRPDNGSVTRIGTDGDALVLLAKGREGQTRIN